MIEHQTISQQTLQEYFFVGIARESKALLPPLSEGAAHYLSQVLIRFSESKHLFVVENDGYMLPTLALLYQDANRAQTSYQRNITLRQLGDSALFMGALFDDYFSKKGIGRDYFVGMGGAAYSSLGDCQYGDTELFYELAERFPNLLQVMANVCARQLNYDADDIFALIERWQATKDEMAWKHLNNVGVLPFELKKRH